MPWLFSGLHTKEGTTRYKLWEIKLHSLNWASTEKHEKMLDLGLKGNKHASQTRICIFMTCIEYKYICVQLLNQNVSVGQ